MAWVHGWFIVHAVLEGGRWRVYSMASGIYERVGVGVGTCTGAEDIRGLISSIPAPTLAGRVVPQWLLRPHRVSGFRDHSRTRISRTTF